MTDKQRQILAALRRYRAAEKRRTKTQTAALEERDRLFKAGRAAKLTSVEMGEAAGVDQSTVRATFMEG
jgi:hypothetical protein